MGLFLVRKWRTSPDHPLSLWVRSLRSDAALEAIAKASDDKVPNIVLYNYPSFSGAYSALFAHLFHTRHNVPCLILPFSSVEPFRFCFNLIFFIPRRIFFFPVVFIYYNLLFSQWGFRVLLLSRGCNEQTRFEHTPLGAL